MSLYIRLIPVHLPCNSNMNVEGEPEILICAKCNKRILKQNLDINKLEIIDNKYIKVYG